MHTYGHLFQLEYMLVELGANRTWVMPELDLARMMATWDKAAANLTNLSAEDTQKFIMMSALPLYGTPAWDVLMKYVHLCLHVHMM